MNSVMLYCLEGFLKKEKRQDKIFVIASSLESALEKVSSFANEIVEIQNPQKLNQHWQCLS